MKNIQMVDLQNVKRFKHSSRRRNFQKVNILHFQLAAGRGKKLYFLFSCDNISPLKAGMKRLIEFKATEIIYPIL